MPQLVPGTSGRAQDGSAASENSLMLMPWSEAVILPASAPPSLDTSNEKALFMPSGRLPKFWETGVRVILAGSAPVPERVAGASLIDPVPPTFSWAVLAPEVVGLKRT